MESRESCLAADGRAWKVDGRAQALVGPGLATPLVGHKKPARRLSLLIKEQGRTNLYSIASN